MTDRRANKECDEKGMRTPEREEYPLKMYPYKANLKNIKRGKRLHSPKVRRHRIDISNKVS